MSSNCISKNNYKWYFGWVISAVIADVYLIAVVFGEIGRDSNLQTLWEVSPTYTF